VIVFEGRRLAGAWRGRNGAFGAIGVGVTPPPLELFAKLLSP
jgi:hypothetical protein